MAGLAVLFAVLMSLPFLVPHLGFLALFGFVPLLFMDTLADLHRTRHFWWWHYAAFVLWNAATTFWVCNATVGGGIFAVLANAFQMSLLVACYRFGKRFLSNTLSYALLVTLWVAWERFYFSAQISWPWLTLGNAFARTTALVQWYEYTGALGGSLWIWLCNLGAFLLLLYLLGGSFRSLPVLRRIALPLCYAVVLLAPMALSIAMYRGFEEQTEDRIDVVVAQPNFDPYQKFESMTQEQQNAVLIGQLREALASRQPSAPHLLLVGPRPSPPTSPSAPSPRARPGSRSRPSSRIIRKRTCSSEPRRAVSSARRNPPPRRPATCATTSGTRPTTPPL